MTILNCSSHFLFGHFNQINSPYNATIYNRKGCSRSIESIRTRAQHISTKSCAAIKELGKGIEWIHSYVAGNKIYCVYEADNEELVRRSSEMAGLPVTTITEVTNVISPANAE